MTRIVLFVATLFLLAASADMAAAATYPTLQAALRTLMSGDTSTNYPAATRNRLLDCGAQSFVAGIPVQDNTAMLAVFNGQKLTPQTDAVFRHWFGYSPTAPQPSANPAVIARIQANARRLCPDLLQQYPDFFQH
ncbi:MAG: hypothetical protein ABWY00_01000 [Dongiaceae bacterium]